jgi:glycosyltransferase involved in cell wall biosynthesis
VTGISLYVPAYNAEPWLERCLDAIRKQTRPPDEVIVVDDGSRDRTREIAERAGVRVLIHEKNRGLGAARNTAIRNARYDLIASLSLPDRWRAQHMRQHWGASEQPWRLGNSHPRAHVR